MCPDYVVTRRIQGPSLSVSETILLGHASVLACRVGFVGWTVAVRAYPVAHSMSLHKEYLGKLIKDVLRRSCDDLP